MLKFIGITILVIIGIVGLFVICFIGKGIFEVLGYMIRFIFSTIGGAIAGIITLIFIIYLLAELFGS